jgi:hypothetical protein
MIISLSAVKSAANGTAWKTAGMRGYVKKTVPSGAAADTFSLDFVQADGDVYSFAWDGTKFTYSGKVAHDENGVIGSGSPVAESKLELDEYLLSLVMGSDSWVAGTALSYDTARLNPATVTGEW